MNALFLHYINFSVNNALIKLHIWNTIHEQAADAVLSLIYCNLMASLVKLVCCRKS